jgi:cytochrome b6-f complex iron-sulfur subunit
MLGALAIKFLDMGAKIATPPRKEGTIGGVFHLGSVADLPKAGEAPLAVSEGRFWLVCTDAGLLALHMVCTHLECLHDWNSATESFVCPCHGSEFGLDGRYQKGPAGRSLDRFPIRLVNAQGEIVAATDMASGAPLPVPELGLTGESESDNASTEIELFVEVDTGSKILGAPTS